MTDTERFEAEGSNAMATMRAALDGFNFDPDRIKRVSLEVDLEENGIDGNTKGGKNSPKSEGRELEKARKDTQVHYALWVMHDHGEPLSPGDAAQEYVLSKSQFSSAFSQAFQRMLADRTPWDGEYGFDYEINAHGVGELERLGTPNHAKDD